MIKQSQAWHVPGKKLPVLKVPPVEAASSTTWGTSRLTRVIRVDVSKVGQFVFEDPERKFLADWKLIPSASDSDSSSLQEAAQLIRNTNVPVAFPTETVYGLGADATRSSAVCGIYYAKQRPSDNPLIVHIASLTQLRRLLNPDYSSHSSADPIPSVYQPLIERFWPGPLTILLPLPSTSPFAPEVTAALPTVAVRMPSSRLALALIRIADVPLAAPSANASTKPSPTTAAHVLHDLDRRIDLILDGGACDVGVESTVVDGLAQPPLILRPGGVSIEMLRDCPGWEDVQIGYNEGSQIETARAPGMKYKHYSPKARVVLVRGALNKGIMRQYRESGRSIGVLRTRIWNVNLFNSSQITTDSSSTEQALNPHCSLGLEAADCTLDTTPSASTPSATFAQCFHVTLDGSIDKLSEDVSEGPTTIWTVGLGSDVANIARGLFSALRELDSKGVSVMFVEGVDDQEGNAAAAVMNRLRKAAEKEITT
ncbi:MAG: hypothetical protein Q9217_006570 [Psora testacea]